MYHTTTDVSCPVEGEEEDAEEEEKGDDDDDDDDEGSDDMRRKSAADATQVASESRATSWARYAFREATRPKSIVSTGDAPGLAAKGAM